MNELIHETGIPASDVDESSLWLKTGVLNEPERYGRHTLKPANAFAAFGLIDHLPMLSAIHGKSSPG